MKKNAPLTIAALTKYIKLKFDTDRFMQGVEIIGEIAQIQERRGHIYFQLKDETALISAIMFAEFVTTETKELKTGDHILVSGDVRVYMKNGTYQLYAKQIAIEGIGKSFLAFEQLKKKLNAEGLFAREHKKKLPKYPRKIAIITANQSAALQDILKTLSLRYPALEYIIFDSVMQGDKAASKIVQKLNEAEQLDFDCIIIARGGGATEDLICFNDENLARAVFACETPVISAIGHEIDFSILDFVADVRAATPTAAIELLTPKLSDVQKEIIAMKRRLKEQFIRQQRYKMEQVAKMFSRIEKQRPSQVLKRQIFLYEKLKRQYANKRLFINIEGKNKQYIENMRTRFIAFGEKLLLQNRNHLKKQIELLHALSPSATLLRGYTITKQREIIISTVDQINLDEQIEISFFDGKIIAQPLEVNQNGKKEKF